MSGIHKLFPRWIGLFHVINKIGTLSYRLELPELYNQLHPVFHISKLKYHIPNGVESQEQILPILTNKILEYKVERIIAQREHGHTTRYLVRWIGYGSEHDLWFSADDLESTPLILSIWQARHQ